MTFADCGTDKARDGLRFGRLGFCAHCRNPERYDEPKHNGFLCEECFHKVPQKLRESVLWNFRMYGWSDAWHEAIADAVYSLR
jgi:hypothetical protein